MAVPPQLDEKQRVRVSHHLNQFGLGCRVVKQPTCWLFARAPNCTSNTNPAESKFLRVATCYAYLHMRFAATGIQLTSRQGKSIARLSAR
eukprot:1318839-Pleurochrysis_carterae.AAC.1